MPSHYVKIPTEAQKSAQHEYQPSGASRLHQPALIEDRGVRHVVHREQRAEQLEWTALHRDSALDGEIGLRLRGQRVLVAGVGVETGLSAGVARMRDSTQPQRQRNAQLQRPALPGIVLR